MPRSPVIVSLPTEDRQTSFGFYRDWLGLEAFGEPADDGVPEPLQFALNDGVHLMLIPTGGFGWLIGDHEVAPRGRSECLLGLSAETDDEVDKLVARAHEAGAEIVADPAQHPWGYTGTFADPDGHLWTVTSEAGPR